MAAIDPYACSPRSLRAPQFLRGEGFARCGLRFCLAKGWRLIALGFAAMALGGAPVLAQGGAIPATPVAQASPAAAAASEIRLGFGLSDDIFLAPVVAAEKLDFFKVAGVTVKRVGVRGGAAAHEALKAGQVEIIDTTGPGVVLALGEGTGERIVATISERFLGWSVIVRDDAVWRSINALGGRRIGISGTRGLPDLAAARLAQMSKVKFEIDPVGAGRLVPSLRDGKLDAVLSSALVGLREVDGGRARIVFDLGRDKNRYLVSAYAASEEMIAKRPRDLRAFLAATFNGLAYMKSNRRWSLDLLKAYARITDDGLAERIYDTIIVNMSADGATDAASLKAGLELAAQAWKLPELAKVEPVKYFTNDFISTAP